MATPECPTPTEPASHAPQRPTGMSRRDLLRRSGLLVAAGVAASAVRDNPLLAWAEGVTGDEAATQAAVAGLRLAADPTDLPAPIRRSTPKHHDITITSDEVDGEIEPGVRFSYMTFGGRIPGPMIRVRQGDTVSLTLKHGKGFLPHNIDLHAVYGPGGGAGATLVGPGESKTVTFQTRYPGAFIYHCAVAGVLDYHISAGMFGMILVEPPEGLPPSTASSTSVSTRSTPRCRPAPRATTPSTTTRWRPRTPATSSSMARSTPSPTGYAAP